MTFRPSNISDNANKPWAYVPSVADIASASFDLAKRDTEIGSLSRMYLIDELSEEDPEAPVPADELNERYPGMDMPFTRPTKARAAQFIYDETIERRQKEQIVAQAKGFWLGGVLPFVSGAAATITDPIGIGIGALTGGIAGKIVKKFAYEGGKMLAIRAGLNFAENLVANSVSEVAFTKRANDKELQTYTANQMITNIIGGSLAGVGMSEGGRFLFGKIHRFPDGPNKQKLQDSSYRITETALDEGKSMSEMASMVDNAIAKDIELDAPIEDAMKRSFGDDMEAEDLIELSDKMREGVEDGTITPEQISDFGDRLNEAKIAENRKGIFTGEYTLSETSADAFEKAMLDPTTDKTYMPKGEEILQAEQIKEADGIPEDMDLRTNDLKEQEAPSDFDTETVNELKRLEKEDKLADSALEFADCIIGGILGKQN